VKDADTIWNLSIIPASEDVVNPGEAKPQTITNIFVKDADTTLGQELTEQIDLIPLTELIMNETSSTIKPYLKRSSVKIQH